MSGNASAKRLRVLWFCNTPLADLLAHWGRSVTGSGHWMHALVGPLAQASAIERLGVVYAGADAKDDHVVLKEVDYYSVRESRFCAITGLALDREHMLKKMARIVEEFQPHIIHIHGTERLYGRLRSHRHVTTPTVVSVQGLMEPTATYAWGEKGFWDIVGLMNRWETVRAFPTLLKRWRYQVAARQEADTLRAVEAVLGRSDWDRSWTRAIAPCSRYFHVNEVMRDPFFQEIWKLEQTVRHQVYTSGRLSFAKGMHTFLEAMALVKRCYPALRVKIAGDLSPSAEAVYLRRLVVRLGLQDNVEFLGWIHADEIARQLKAAHCYVNASFIENGCNALQEAMLMGCPCVATFTGGMVTTLAHRTSGLMVPRHDAPMLADAVSELFERAQDCVRYGQAAREIATQRHSARNVLPSLLHAYREVAAQSPRI